jgi:hypothetical protein
MVMLGHRGGGDVVHLNGVAWSKGKAKGGVWWLPC